VKRLRGSALYKGVRQRVPERARRLAWKASTKPLEHDPFSLELSSEARDAILDRLRPDLERLREIIPGFHCWGHLANANPRAN
jgi:hypothetical protein